MKANGNWIEIPKDKYGLFEDDGSMYAQLPIIVYEEISKNEEFNLYYVNKDNWADWIADFNKERYVYYLPCPKVPVHSSLTTKAIQSINGDFYEVKFHEDNSSPCGLCAFFDFGKLKCGFPCGSYEKRCRITSGTHKGWNTVEYVRISEDRYHELRVKERKDAQ